MLVHDLLTVRFQFHGFFDLRCSFEDFVAVDGVVV